MYIPHTSIFFKNLPPPLAQVHEIKIIQVEEYAYMFQQREDEGSGGSDTA